ncbi:MAG: NlpC/P60 family protein [Paludibacteraceae bacterium]|nr:C40 family peptidase [Prevotellaceae bacterium]
MKSDFFYYILAAGLTLSACSQNPQQESAKDEQKQEQKIELNSKVCASPYSPSSSQEEEKMRDLSQKIGFSIDEDDNLSLYKEVAEWLGTPYLYGGSEKSGADCSGFVMTIYQDIYGLELERQTSKIYQENCISIDKDELREGDLVFFHTGGQNNGTPNYVGIYLKNGKFVSVSSSKGVIINDLSSKYYSKNWVAGGRMR